MKILFGGSFDPIHNGHLAIIRSVIEQFTPEKFFLVPANRSMSKIQYTFTPEERLKLVSEALTSLPNSMRKCIVVSETEILKGRPVYTYETILELQPDTLLIGGDHDYTKWKNYNEIIEPALERILVYPRSGVPETPRNLKEIVLTLPPLNISSMEIIKRAKWKEDISSFVPLSIEAFITGYSYKNEAVYKIGKDNQSC